LAGAKTRSGNAATQKERETQILHKRLLGRKRGAEDRTTMRRAEKHESSDEEAGRSGLGRAKKRARTDEPREEEEKDQPIAMDTGALDSKPEEAGSAGSRDDVLGDDKAGEVVEGATPLPGSSVPDGPEDNPGQKKKKRKKKKKNKDNSKEPEGE
jgi:hypothetical protein